MSIRAFVFGRSPSRRLLFTTLYRSWSTISFSLVLFWVSRLAPLVRVNGLNRCRRLRVSTLTLSLWIRIRRCAWLGRLLGSNLRSTSILLCLANPTVPSIRPDRTRPKCSGLSTMLIGGRGGPNISSRCKPPRCVSLLKTCIIEVMALFGPICLGSRSKRLDLTCVTLRTLLTNLSKLPVESQVALTEE